jgi:hypothetical protein
LLKSYIKTESFTNVANVGLILVTNKEA